MLARCLKLERRDLTGKRVWDRMQKGRQQEWMEIEKQYCDQIDTFLVYLCSVLSNVQSGKNLELN